MAVNTSQVVPTSLGLWSSVINQMMMQNKLMVANVTREIFEREPAVAVNASHEVQTVATLERHSLPLFKVWRPTSQEATHPQSGSLAHRRVISKSANTLPAGRFATTKQCERT